MLDSSGDTISNGSTIDELYLQNYIYNRSTKLAVESTLVRPALLSAALTETAAADFEETALLLSVNTDMLCELLEGVDLNAVVVPTGPVRMPKRIRMQPPRAAKKAALKKA